MPTASEVIASAIADDVFDVDPEPQAKRIADSILSALDKADYAVVPKGLTDRMFKAAMDEADRQGFALDDFSPPIYFTLIYQAMLSAHAKHDEGEVIG